MAAVVNRFDVFLVDLGAAGSGVRQNRPCVVISPDEMNRHIQSVLIAPLTTAGLSYPTRVRCNAPRAKTQIVLDQIRTIEKRRLVKKLGAIDAATQFEVISALQRLFAF